MSSRTPHQRTGCAVPHAVQGRAVRIVQRGAPAGPGPSGGRGGVRGAESPEESRQKRRDVRCTKVAGGAEGTASRGDSGTHMDTRQ
eukprot:scaffold67318_cov19-Tisochrysis_lutea.AAC.1